MGTVAESPPFGKELLDVFVICLYVMFFFL